ncbi:hypothetical protein [Oryza sativa Japonica Group]|uniref:Uncharacterized protein n=2 Tax=Oryza sativa subsp. japonica TaxID=39947 RepID=Q5ZE94_ORYSJ|nr:hypothetical protein [Oryza sativa Japonica Group]BAD61192.1 hypothetical protein [Oryza sativa Japonica Group]
MTKADDYQQVVDCGDGRVKTITRPRPRRGPMAAAAAVDAMLALAVAVADASLTPTQMAAPLVVDAAARKRPPTPPAHGCCFRCPRVAAVAARAGPPSPARCPRVAGAAAVFRYPRDG